MPVNNVPYLGSELVRARTPMPALISALRAGFASDIVVPGRHAHALPAASLLLMPAWTPGGDIGVKVTLVDPAARPSVKATYLLLDGSSGRPRALLDGQMLTARRTAAASALAADYLARQDAHSLLVLGTGALVPHLIEAHVTVRPIERVLIWGRDPAKAQAAASAAGAAGFAAEVAPAIDVAIAQADIISTATLSTRPLIEGRYLRPGVHVDLVGAFRPEMCEADPEAFRRARLFVDTIEGVMSEAGDLLQAFEAGALEPDAIEGDLAALCTGRHQGRGADMEAITLFKSVGTALEDLAAARLICAGEAA